MAGRKKSRKHLRGLASMTPERRKEIATLGGKASQKRGVGYAWDSATAAKASRKGLASRYGKKK